MKSDVKDALVKRSEEVSKQAEFIMAKTRDWQLIKQYMSNRVQDITLTAEQQKKMERYQFIYNEIASGKSTDQQVVNQAKNIYKISLSQAYEDLNATKEIFSTVININKQFELSQALQLNTKYKAKAEEMGDLKALAMFEKNRKDLIKLLPEVEDNSADIFEGHTYEMVFDPTLLGAPAKVDMKELLTAINAKRGKKINIDMFPELEHEDIPNDDSNQETL